ncbi:Serine aminopeptidase, S33 [Paenibacillaceae bacterium GAS479]|nr:Serine aminopeptidase, S33 [Paenibacillaceae bacterium GAS479]
MQSEELKWTCQDGVHIYGRRWLPGQQSIKAAVGIVHGLGEHSGAYDHVAEWFTERGYAVFGFDQRGHGRTEGSRGDCPDYRIRG